MNASDELKPDGAHLPAPEDAAGARNGKIAPTANYHAARQPVHKTVLIADDDHDLVNLLSVRCRRMGLKVLAAYDAFTALSLVRSRRPDVICLDVEMPAGNGLSVCEMLTSDDAYGGKPIVVLTGRTDPDTICRCHTLCAYYVEKCPDIWSRLEPLLRELLDPVPPSPVPLVAVPARNVEPTVAESNVECEPAPSAAGTIEQRIVTQTVADSSPVLPAVVPTFTQAEPESLWRHLTQVVGRVVGHTAAEDEPGGEPDCRTTARVDLADETTPAPTAAGGGNSLHSGPARTHQRENDPMPKTLKAETEKTVLIADDDGDLVQMIALRCSQIGLTVFRSPDAMHALLGAHRIRPDLVLLDVNMPGGNGLSICEMMGGDKELAKTPVIIMTGDTNEEIPRRCQVLKAQFLPKGTGLWERLEPLIRRSLGLSAAATAKKESPHCPSETDVEGQRPRILCIDDDPDISKILKLRLEPFGVDVLRAFNGMQGYWTALDMRPDMIILDMVMPDGAGNYIFGRLRSHPLTEKVPVLMLTGVNTPGVRRQMFGMGVDAYLTKPLDFNTLLDHIRQYVPLVQRDESAARNSNQAADEHSDELAIAGKALR